MRGARTQMSIYTFIENLRNGIESKQYDAFTIALIISYMYKGEIYCCNDDFISKVGDDFYDIDGLIPEEDLSIDEYFKFANSHVEDIAEEYELTRMKFILPYVDIDDHLTIDINLN
jgi:hypothetical protein